MRVFYTKKSLATEDFVLIVRAGYFVHDSFGVGCVARFLFISTIIFFFFSVRNELRNFDESQ